MPKKGDVINGDYQIIGQFANGGMSSIHKAQDFIYGGYIAIKKLETPSGFSRDESIKMFEREADMLKEVRGHNCFPQFKNYILYNGEYYIVMEYIEGDNLENILKSKTLSEGEIKDIALNILNALEILHKKGIIYRDMKPANIIISDDNRVVLCDFGTARYLKDQKVSNAQTSKISSTQVGTLEFASPEHFGGLCDERSDLYCLARTIYFCFTKTFDIIFPTKDDINQLTITKSFKNFLIKALKFDKEDRFQNIDEMRKALKRVKVDKKSQGQSSPVVFHRTCKDYHFILEIVVMSFIVNFILLFSVLDDNLLWLGFRYLAVLTMVVFLYIGYIVVSEFKFKNCRCIFHHLVNGIKWFVAMVAMFLKKINFGGWKDVCRFWGSYCPPIIFLVNWFGWWTIGKVIYLTGVMNWFWIISIGMSVFLIWFAIYKIIDDHVSSTSGLMLLAIFCYWILGVGVLYGGIFNSQTLDDENEFYLKNQYEETDYPQHVDIVNTDKPFLAFWVKNHEDDKVFVFYNGDKIELFPSNGHKYEGQIKLCLSETITLKFLIVCKERKKIIRREFVINVKNGKDILDLTQDSGVENENQNNITDLTDKKI